MDIQEALNIVVARTGVGRYRQLCDPGHPDYNPAYIPWVLKEAGAPPGPVARAANLARAVVAHVRAGMPAADAATAAARLATCRACDQLEGESCRMCGCSMPVKVTWGEQSCPIGRWGPVG